MRFIGLIVLVVAAVFVYAGMMGCIADATHTDAAGRGMAMGFAVALGVVLWLLLIVMTVIGFTHGRRPRWVKAAAVGLLPLSAVAAATAAGLYIDRHDWALALVATLPLLLMLMALWPGAGPSMAGLVLVLSVIPLVWSGRDVQHDPVRAAALGANLGEKAKAERSASEREAAAFTTLGPDAKLVDLLPFLQSNAHSEQALLNIQRLKTRQADAVALLRHKPLAELTDLWQFNIMPTRQMCEGYRDALAEAVNRVTRARSDSVNNAIELEWQLPNIKWLVAAKCDLSGTLSQAETNVLSVADSPRLTNFAHTLGDLKGFR